MPAVLFWKKSLDNVNALCYNTFKSYERNFPQMKKPVTLLLTASLVLTVSACRDSDSDYYEKLSPGVFASTIATTSTETAADTTQKSGGNPPPEVLDETPLEFFAYKYNAELHGVEITEYSGKSLKVRIPGEVDGYPVTVIGKNAFKESGIAYVYIPDSVAALGKGAFQYCAGLTSVNLPGGVTDIGDGAFWYCTGLTSVNIPDSVVNIGEGAFNGCSSLAVIVVPDGVKSVGAGAFYGCENLTASYKGKKYAAAENDRGNYDLPEEFYAAVNGA